MRNDALIASCCQSLGLQLDCFNFQLLWLMPIIEVMWADGHCQKEEVETLFHYLERFVKLVNDDVPEITFERARQFFLPLLKTSAIDDPRMRAKLTRLVDHIVQHVVEPAHQDKRLYLFEICKEVAEAAQWEAPAGNSRKIVLEEELLLKDLFRDLRLGKSG